MTNPEREIMCYFRRYRIQASEMLFFSTGPAKANPQQFYHAMTSPRRSGMVVKERHPHAYSLTQLGYRAVFRPSRSHASAEVAASAAGWPSNRYSKN